MDVKDGEAVVAAMRKAVQRKVTAEELQQQRVSFVYSSLKEGTGITKAKIKDMLDSNCT